MKKNPALEALVSLGRIGAGVVKRLFSKAEPEKAAIAKTASAPLGYKAALEETRKLSQLAEAGLVEEASYARTASQVLSSPSATALAGDIARTTHRVIREQLPNSPELIKTLAQSHRQLDLNISHRKAQAQLVSNSDELSHLHVANINDARTLISTGAPPTMRNDAIKDIAEGIERLLVVNPAEGNRLMREVSRDNTISADVTRAVRDMHARDAAAHQAALRQQEDHEVQRLRNLGVVMPRPPAGTHTPAHFDTPELTRVIQETTKPRPARPAHEVSRVEVAAAMQHRQMPGVTTQEIDMSAFNAARQEAAAVISHAKGGPATEARHVMPMMQTPATHTGIPGLEVREEPKPITRPLSPPRAE